jgi:hypothetical protein
VWVGAGGSSWWIWLEALNPLVLPNVRHDPFHVSFVQAGYGLHVPETPVMLPDSVVRSKGKRTITVMVRLVHNRQVRRSILGPPEIRAVAFGAVCLIQNVAFSDKRFVLWRYTGVQPTLRAARSEEQTEYQQPGECTMKMQRPVSLSDDPTGEGPSA